MPHTCSKAREQENGLSELRGQEEGEPSPNPTDGKQRPSVGREQVLVLTSLWMCRRLLLSKPKSL